MRTDPLLPSLLVLFASLAAAQVHAGDLCQCGPGDDFEWLDVSSTTGGGWTCSGGDGQPGPDDDFVIGEDCRVVVRGDIVQDGASPGTGIEVAEDGRLEVRATSAGKRVLSLGEKGFVCSGSCHLEGVFRRPTGAGAPLQPTSWPLDGLLPCDGDCAATPELGCLEVPLASAQGLSEFRTATDLETGTEDWLCLWDFDKSDSRVSRDDNACYPIARVSIAERRVCVDVRQGRDSDYPHRLRVIQEARLAQGVLPGDGCGVVLDPDDSTVAPSCAGQVLRIDPAPGIPDPIQSDGELVGRFLRFADGSGDPLDASYKILQTFDCQAAPATPHVCAGDPADVVVLGLLSGVAEAHATGEVAWIDYGWRAGDEAFVLVPVQLQSATPQGDDSGVLVEGTLHAVGVHFTNLGGSHLAQQPNATVRLGAAEIEAWRHVIIRNDTGDFVPNTGSDLNPDALEDATLGHTNIVSNSGHAVLIGTDDGDTEDLVFEDFSIRHHQDGCFNHSLLEAEPEVTIRRSWCAFIQSDAQSAQWFAWQLGDPGSTVVEDSACDACDGGHAGETLRTNNPDAGGFTLRRSLLWSPIGVLPSTGEGQVENLIFLGLGGTQAVSAPLLGHDFRHSVARGIAMRAAKPVLKGQLDVEGSILRDILVDWDGVGAVIATDDSVVSNSAFLGFDSRSPTCAAGSPNCVVLQEAKNDTEDVSWIRTLVAWPPGATTRLAGAMRFRAQGAGGPPEYHGVAIAHHHFRFGQGTAFSKVTGVTVGIPDWDDGPCFQDNDQDVAASAQPGLPPETSQGIPLGFVDAAHYRFDTPVGSQADQVGCGLDPAEPPGQRGYHYVHARTGLAPELMGDDDGDGWPEGVPAPACNGTDEMRCSDNCPGVFNPDQADVDGNGIGNACDAPCADGRDNDSDGLVDYPDDPQCSHYQDAPEGAGCGLGFEAAPALLALSLLRRRRAATSALPA